MVAVTLLLQIAAASPLANAALPPLSFPSTGRSALLSLKQCQASQAALWAKNLDGIDRQLGLLYRLSWLQQAAQASLFKNHEVIEITDKVLIWPWVGEHWRDEILSARELPLCDPGAVTAAIAFENLPAEMLEELLTPQLSSVASLRRPMRQILLQYALFNRLRGRVLPARKVPEREPPFSKDEKCEWDAIAVLNDTSSSFKEFESLLSHCRPKQTVLWSVVQIEAGDRTLRERRGDEALSLYRSVLADLTTDQIPDSLWYRIAVSALISGKADDQGLLAAHKVLSRQEDKGGMVGASVTPIYIGALKNILCERLAALRSTDSVRLLTQVFNRDVLVSQAIALHQACESEFPDGMLKALLRRTMSQRDRSKLLGELLHLALLQRDLNSAIGYTKSLARISHALPTAANYSFWKALSNKTYVTEVVSVYRRQARWTDVDEMKYGRWKKAQKEVKESHLADLKVENKTASNSINLPVALAIPSFVWNERISANFISAFEKDLQNLSVGSSR